MAGMTMLKSQVFAEKIHFQSRLRSGIYVYNLNCLFNIHLAIKYLCTDFF